MKVAGRNPEIEFRRLGREFGEAYVAYRAGGRCDLESMNRKLGGAISVRKPDSNRLLTVRSEGDFTVEVNEHTGVRRDNFAIAQALGHYQLHFLGKLDALPTQSDDLPRIEFVFDDEPGVDESTRRRVMVAEARLFARGLLTGGVDLLAAAGANQRSLAKELQMPRGVLEQEVAVAVQYATQYLTYPDGEA